MKRNRTKKNFIIVAELKTGIVKAIIEGPSERGVSKTMLGKIDNAILYNTRELDQKFPAVHYDVIVTRAPDLKELKSDFPEFSGWELLTQENLLIET